MEQAIETEAKVEIPDAAPEAAPKPTAEELKSGGMTDVEIEKAQKLGMVGEKPKPAPAPVKDEKTEEPKPHSSLPDFTFKTPEQEKAWLEAFGPGTEQRAMYFRMMNERRSRQRVESEKAALAAENAALKAGKTAPAPQTDEQGNVIDPDSQPFTLKAWKEMRKAEAEEYQRQQEAVNNRARVLADAHVEQEAYAREVHPDFDETIPLTKEVISNLNALVLDPGDREDVEDLIQKLQIAAARADQIGPDQRSAADIAYKIGKYHPNYGKQPKKTGQPDPKATGGHSPEQLKRIEANTQRRPSSASVPTGGGKRTVNPSEVDLPTLKAMGLEGMAAFKLAHPKEYARALRG